MVWMTVLLFLSFAVIIARLAHLQLAQGQDYKVQADNQRTSVLTIEPARGEIKIVDKFTGQPDTVATSIEKPLVYAVPASMTDRENTAKVLAPILGITEQEILDKTADNNKKYVPLKRQLSDEDKKKILGGIKSFSESALRNIAFSYKFLKGKKSASVFIGFIGNV